MSKLPLGSRLLYLAFLFLVMLAFATSIALYTDALGLDAQGAADWYRGNADQPGATEILMGKSARELLEITHFHLYTQPVLFLVLAHLFLLSRGGDWKEAVVAAAFLFTLGHIAAPWMVWNGYSGLWMPLTAVPFLLLYGLMALWPVPDLLSR